MTSPNNLQQIDVSQNNSTASSTAQNYFNNYFVPSFNVSQNVDDAIVAKFEQIADNKDAARALASAVIYTAAAQGKDPMSILQEFLALPNGQLSLYLAMFLNLNRIGTSYLGLNNAPKVGKYIARTILA